jgi:tetratricopeptide (TPR) repeat protein
VQRSIIALLAEKRFDTVLRTLELSLDAARTQREQRELLSIMTLVPLDLQQSSPSWMTFAARIRCVAADLVGLQSFLEHIPITERTVKPYRAWVALRADQFEEALELACEIIPQAQGFERGLLWRVRAVALFKLQRDGWREAFAQARAALSGVSLGRCLLEEGVCEDLRGSGPKARSIWAQALALLGQDAHYSAQLRYNIGLSNLRSLLPEAETHFLEMERLSHRAEATDFRGRALCGIAASRRALGELERAAFMYERAIQEATDDDDRRQARWGLGHTHRLMGRFTDALIEFERAATTVELDRVSGSSWVFVSIAAIHAQTGNAEAAQNALERAGSLDNHQEDAQRAHVVRAELARQAKDVNLALRELEFVHQGTLLAREERRCFPALFTVAEAMGRVAPTDTPEPHLTVVSIHAWGSMRVAVNGRSVTLKPGGRAAELLALLVYHDRRLSSERILEAMYRLTSDADDRRRKRQALWAAANELRQALGWSSSIVNENGVYALDDRASWEITPADLRSTHPNRERFLDGVTSEWALEVNWRIQDKTDRTLN